MPPKSTIHMNEYTTGAVRVPLMNCLMVLPLEIFAMNIPTNGHQEIHHPQ